MLFTALAAPELLIPDRRDGVLSILASRPLTVSDYLSTRFASLVAIVAGFMILPQLLLFVGEAATDTDGLLNGFINAADTLPKIAAVAAVYTVAFVPMGFFISSLSNRKAIATATYLAVMIALTSIAAALVHSSTVGIGRWAALISPINTADAANAWIFDRVEHGSLLDAAGIHPGYGIVALIVMGAVMSLLSFNRYRRLM